MADTKLTIALAAALAVSAGMNVNEISNDEAQKEATISAYMASYDSLSKKQAKVKEARDSIISPETTEQVRVDVLDSTGKVIGFATELRRIKPRNIYNCDSKYPCPLVTGKGWTFTTTTVLSRPGLSDSTVSIITDSPEADRLHVVYTTTAEK